MNMLFMTGVMFLAGVATAAIYTGNRRLVMACFCSIVFVVGLKLMMMGRGPTVQEFPGRCPHCEEEVTMFVEYK